MSPTVFPELHGAVAANPFVARGILVEIHSEGWLVVDVPTPEPRRVLCEFLQTTQQPALKLEPGDSVLLLLPTDAERKGCVLGRIGPYRAPETERVSIEAERELTLKCGEAAITMRNDGKVVTRAVDIAAVAKRRHRIKGGSVDIN